MSGLLEALAGAAAGASIAGVFTVLGARAGGRKAVEAAEKTVDGQAAAARLQWFRDNRRQAYADLSRATSAVLDALALGAQHVSVNGALAPEPLAEIDVRRLEVISGSAGLALWGPVDVVRAGQEIVDAMTEAIRELKRCANSRDRGASPVLGAYMPFHELLVEKQALFLAAAGAVLKDPERSKN